MPLADGGEGSLEAIRHAIGGELRRLTVPGPLGRPTDARWLFLADTSAAVVPPPLVAGHDPIAVIEACEAAGRHLLPTPGGDDPLEATTTGVGELVAAAFGAGARQVVVCVGGTATTDGGWGAVAALARLGDIEGARLVVAADVETRFVTAAPVFSPQKGASPDQVRALGERLAELADRYQAEFGTKVEWLPGAGAGGGLAGGLAALGATIVPGFPLIAGVVGLERRLAHADLAMTGEGLLDATSFAGKVVGGVCNALGGTVPVLCVAGAVATGVSQAFGSRAAPVEVVSLVELVGARRAVEETEAAVEEAVTASLVARGVAR